RAADRWAAGPDQPGRPRSARTPGRRTDRARGSSAARPRPAAAHLGAPRQARAATAAATSRRRAPRARLRTGLARLDHIARARLAAGRRALMILLAVEKAVDSFGTGVQCTPGGPARACRRWLTAMNGW